MSRRIKELVSSLVYEDVASVLERELPWEELDHKRILITGANGFISYYMVLACLIRNDLYGSDIRICGLVRNLENARKKYGDILEREDLELLVQDVCETIQTGKTDMIIHAASQASPWHFEKDPVGTIDANLRGTRQVLELAKKYQAQVVMISSLKIYGNFGKIQKESIREEDRGEIDQTSYKSCYAMGKLAAETICASYSRQYGLTVKIVRPGYIYGPTTRKDDRVWAQFMGNIMDGQDIVLKSSGAPYRSYCYVTDTVAAIFTVLLKGENMQPYNIAAEIGNITIRGLARAAVEAFPERNLKLSFANKEDEEEPDIRKSPREILNNERLRSLGWEARMGLTEGFARGVLIMEEQERAEL